MIKINSAKNLKAKGDKFKISFQLMTTFALLCILFNLITAVNSLDEKKEIEARFRHSSKLQKISNNKVKFDYDQNKGFYCRANDFIKEKEHLFDIPKSMTISPLYIFPFKFELFDILLNLDEIKNSENKDQKIGIYLLTFQVLILRYSPMRSMKKYIRDHEYKDYYDFFEPDTEFFDSFPSFVPSLNIFTKEEQDLLLRLKMTYPIGTEALSVYEGVRKQLRDNHDFSDDILYAIVDYKRFIETFSIIISRAITNLHLEHFYKLEGFTENNPNHSALTKKNIQYNKFFSNSGVLSLISFVDICNHGQPKSFIEKNVNKIEIDSKKGYFMHFASNNWRPGEEILFNYSSYPSNIILALNFGFVIKKNIFDNYEIVIKDSITFNDEQIKFCIELGCFLNDIKTPKDVLKERKELINYNQLNENLLNYGRVRMLKSNFDRKKIYKKLMKEKFISKTNELASYIFYFNVMTEDLTNESEAYGEIFRVGPKVKNSIKLFEKIEEKNLDEEKVWKSLKIRETIYDTALIIRNILIVHSNKIIDKIIQKSSENVQNLKEKYLNKF